MRGNVSDARAYRISGGMSCGRLQMPKKPRRADVDVYRGTGGGSEVDVYGHFNRAVYAGMWRGACFVLILLSTGASAQDINGDLNTNIGDNSTVDSNNASESVTNNYNSGPPGAMSNPVPTAMAPTVMGGGGNDSCLIPSSAGIQVSLFGIAQGSMEQDPECNRRKDARLLGAPQAAGGLGLQVSGISVMCASSNVFRAMALASTPCPIFDVNRNQLLTGRDAFEMMRSDPANFVVGYNQDRAFWDAFLRIGEPLDEIEIVSRVPISERLRTSLGRTDDVRSSDGGGSDQRPASTSE